MGTHRKRFLHDLSTFVTLLRREARIHSFHTMPGSFSLVTEDVEKCTPTGVCDGFRKVMVLDHVRDLKVFHCKQVIPLSIRFCYLEMVIAALPSNLHMRLCDVLRSFTAAVTALLASTQLALFASQGSLRGAIEARVLNRVALTISQERFQSNITTNVRMLTRGGEMLSLKKCLADDQSVPVSISTQDQMDCFGCPFERAVQLDLDGLAHLGRNDEVFLVLVQIAIFAILPQLDGMPLVALLKSGEAHLHRKFFAGKKTFEGFGEAICKTLYCGGRDILSAASFETSGEIILPWKRALVLVLCFDSLKHLIIEDARLTQALHEQVGLFFMWVQAVFKRSHSAILTGS